MLTNAENYLTLLTDLRIEIYAYNSAKNCET